MPAIKHGQVYNDTAQETSLTKPKKEPRNHQSSIRLHEARERTNGPPADYEPRDVVPGLQLLQDPVTRHIDADVRYVEDRQSNVEFGSSEFEILDQTVDFGIANVAAVDEGEEPDAKEPWDYVEVEFAVNAVVDDRINCWLIFEGGGLFDMGVVELIFFEVGRIGGHRDCAKSGGLVGSSLKTVKVSNLELPEQSRAEAENYMSIIHDPVFRAKASVDPTVRRCHWCSSWLILPPRGLDNDAVMWGWPPKLPRRPVLESLNQPWKHGDALLIWRSSMLGHCSKVMD